MSMKGCLQTSLTRAAVSVISGRPLCNARGGMVSALMKDNDFFGCVRLQLSLIQTNHLGTFRQPILCEAAENENEDCFPWQSQRRRVSNGYFPSKSQRRHVNNGYYPSNSKSQRRHGKDAAGAVSHQTNRWQDQDFTFGESENEYFYSYLGTMSEYQPYLLSSLCVKETSGILPSEEVATLLEEVKTKKNTEHLLLLLDHWTAMSNTVGDHVLSDDAFGLTVRLLKKNSSRLSHGDAIECMAKLNQLGFRQSILSHSEPRKNRILLSKTFDQLCSKRIKNFDVKELLLSADFFFSVRGSSFTDFPYLMCERMKFFLPTMGKAELILLLFHMGLARRGAASLINGVLDRLKEDMPSLTLQELGIVNLAHYKTRLHINQPAYFTALTQQLQTDASHEVNPICLSSVLKYQQKSLNKYKNQLVPQFFTTVRDLEDPLLLRLATLPSETFMHVLNLYYSLDLLSEDLFMAAIDRIINQGLGDWRLKDLAKVTHIFANVPMGSERKKEALAAILAELRRPSRNAEKQNFPECLLQIAVSLTYCNVYPHWLAEEIFSDASQSKFKGSDIDYRRDLYHLSESIMIEDGTYIGPILLADCIPRLSKNNIYGKLLLTKEGRKICGGFVKNAGQKKTTADNGIFTRDWILLEVMEALVKTRPQVTPVPAFLLSHFQTPDVEVKVATKGSSKRKPASDPFSVETVSEAVVLHAGNAYQNVRSREGKVVPLVRQYHAMRARHLRKLGATVVEVSHLEFQDCKDKGQLLKSKLNEEVNRQTGLHLD